MTLLAMIRCSESRKLGSVSEDGTIDSQGTLGVRAGFIKEINSHVRFA
jgi:hypothetical protein